MQLIHSIYTLEPEMGLLSENGGGRSDLYGYAITLDGQVVVQQFLSGEDDYIGDDLTWDDLLPRARHSSRAA